MGHLWKNTKADKSQMLLRYEGRWYQHQGKGTCIAYIEILTKDLGVACPWIVNSDNAHDKLMKQGPGQPSMDGPQNSLSFRMK